MLAYVVPTIVAIGLTGAIVSKYGHYVGRPPTSFPSRSANVLQVPYMVVGIAIASIAAGFLTQLDAHTPAVKWAALIVVHRMGMGMAQQLPYTALQSALEPSDTATGNAIAIFSWQLGGSIAVSVGQNLLLNSLRSNIPKHTAAVSVQQVIDAGAGGLKALAPNTLVLRQLRKAYAESLKGTYVLALVGTCLALPFAVGMQWLNIKRVAEERRGEADRGKGESAQALKGEVELVSKEAGGSRSGRGSPA